MKLICVTLFAVAVLASAMASADDVIPIHQHSLEPPLLVNYEESGMPFWTIGGKTVVTNDYVRLTPKSSAGRGYMWNRHPANMLQGQVNFTIRASATTGFRIFGSSTEGCTTCGTAFWHVADASRHGSAQFFGIPNKFRGLGIVFPTSGRMHLVQSDGQSNVMSLQEVTMASCVFTVDNHPRTIVITFADGVFDVSHFPTKRPTSISKCATQIRPQFVEPRYYFGFTSYFANEASSGTDILGMSAAGALDPETDKYAKENLRYDPAEEMKHRKLWDGAEDEPKTDAQKKEAAGISDSTTQKKNDDRSQRSEKAPSGEEKKQRSDQQEKPQKVAEDGAAGDNAKEEAKKPKAPEEPVL